MNSTDFEIEKEEFGHKIEFDGQIDGTLSFSLDELFEKNNIEIKELINISQIYVGYKYPEVTSSYLIEDLDPLIDYINQHGNSYNALLAFKNAISRFFPKCPLKLEYYEDPEDSVNTQLLLTILFDGNPDEASLQLCLLESECPEIFEYDFVVLDIEFV